MTFIEQTCQRQVMEIWHMRSTVRSVPEKVVALASRYFETIGGRPTCSASLVLLSGFAAAGATLYRRKAPAFARWKREVMAEPKVLSGKITELRTKTREELQLHQEIFARFLLVRDR